jgi:hypothetical protein
MRPRRARRIQGDDEWSSLQLIAPQSGVFHRFVSDLQQQPLLRVEPLGFGWKVSEELGVELIASQYAVGESMPPGKRQPMPMTAKGSR